MNKFKFTILKRNRIPLIAITLFLLQCGPDTLSVEEGYKEVNGVRHFYKMVGEGEAFIVLHGGPGMYHDELFPFFLDFARDKKLIFYDQRGNGKSVLKEIDSTTFNVELMVEDLEGLRKAFGIEKLNIIGHSWGGLLAMYYGVEYPENLKRLILVDAAPVNTELLIACYKKQMSMFKPEELERVQELWESKEFLEGNPEVHNEAMRISEGTVFSNKSVIDDYMEVAAFNKVTAANAVALNELATQMKLNIHVQDRLSNIKCPTLIINGKDDFIVEEAVQRTNELILNSEVAYIENAGHYPFIENKETFFDELNRFIERTSNENGQGMIQDVKGMHLPDSNRIWLSHEHILVDFIGADSIRPDAWDHDSVLREVLPYLEELNEFKVDYFVDATPNFLGRDAALLERIADRTGLRILTNTGLYGARDNKFIPSYAYEMTAEDLAGMWIEEFEHGIDGTSIKPGFVKIGVDASDPLDPVHEKLVRAAALTHLQTGLTIASHTGEAKGLWPQLRILEEMGVSPRALIWVHAQNEEDHQNYLKAAEMGCWISLDGLGWELENHVEKLVFAKRNGILDRILISHDAGWYDPQKTVQTLMPYNVIFKKLYPALKSRGFTDDDFNQLTRVNPSKAYAIEIRESLAKQ